MAQYEFSDEIKIILEKIKTRGMEDYHKTVNTTHAFLALNATLRQLAKEENETNKEIDRKFRAVIAKYKLDSEKFKEAYNCINPTSIVKEDEKFIIEMGADLSTVFRNLKKLVLEEGRTATLPDFIHELFSDTSYEIFSALDMVLGATDAVEFCKDMKECFKTEIPKIETIEELDGMSELTNINSFVASKNMTFVNSEHVVDQLRMALSCKNINCAALVGKAGTGKTMAVYALADAINRGVAGDFNGKLIYQLDMGSCVAGTQFRGSFEQKLKNIIEAISENKDKVILFIDEMHTIVGAGGSSEGSLDASNILKPYITRGDIQIIGATTPEEFSKTIEKDKAFERRFHRILISEPSKEETRVILEGLLEDFESFYNKKASPDLIKNVIDLSVKYVVDQANPAKSINILDLAFAHCKIFNEDNEIVLDQSALDAIQLKYDIEIVPDRTKATMEALRKEILGQEDILNNIEGVLRGAELGLVNPMTPIASLIFSGPSGTGKTETARLIARHYFGNETNLIKINMNEYASEMDVTKLIGSAPGYVGSTDESDLVKSIKNKPSSVVLFDEVEKAHPKVFDTLLSILDCGEMKDNFGNLISFKNAIIIFTTNLGYKAGFSEDKGLGFFSKSTTTEDILDSVKKNFRPEFINRINDIIVFNALTNDVGKTLIDRYVSDFESYSGLKFNLSEDDYAAIIKDANIPEYGARGLKRCVQKHLIKLASVQNA